MKVEDEEEDKESLLKVQNRQKTCMGGVPVKWKSQSSRCIHCREIAVLLAGRLRIDKHQVDDSKCHRYNKRPWSKIGKDRRCSKPVTDMDGLSGARLLVSCLTSLLTFQFCQLSNSGPLSA